MHDERWAKTSEPAQLNAQESLEPHFCIRAPFEWPSESGYVAERDWLEVPDHQASESCGACDVIEKL